MKPNSEKVIAKLREDLQKSERRQSLILEALPLAFYTTGVSARFPTTWVSHNVLSLTGFPAQQFIKDPGFWISRVHPEDKERFLKIFQRILKKGSLSLEYRWQLADGSYFWFLNEAILIKDPEGEPHEIIGIWLDITDRKKLDQIKDEFISMVSHELRTPLTTIKEAVANLYDELAGPINEKQKRVLALTQRNVDRLARIVKKILDLSRLESGRAKPSLVPIDLAQKIQEVFETLGTKALQKNVVLSSDLADPIPPFMADSDMLSELLINLIDNGLRFTKSRIKVKAEVMSQERQIKVAVMDDGPGIAEEKMHDLFTKFSQIDRPQGGGGYKGTGLGLAICREIVQLHKGKIGVENMASGGSEFYFTLPLTQE